MSVSVEELFMPSEATTKNERDQGVSLLVCVSILTASLKCVVAWSLPAKYEYSGVGRSPSDFQACMTSNQ